MQDISESIEACAARYGEQADAMREYLLAGQAEALALDNRGPIEFDASGKLAQHILEAYSKYGFYVFTGIKILHRATFGLVLRDPQQATKNV